MATLLEGVNRLLLARGLTQVNQIASGHPLQANAVVLLEKFRELVASRRWWYNTETEYQFSYNAGSSTVPIPSDVLRLADTTYLVRQGLLYDPVEHTNVFTENPDTMTVLFNVDWEDLPVTAFNYIVEQAKEEFIRPMNDILKTQQAKIDIKTALVFLQGEDLDRKAVSVLTNPLVAKWKTKMLVR